MFRYLVIAAFCAALGTTQGASSAAALDPEIDTDGFNPAAESYQLGEARRRDQIARQLDLNRRMIWSSGFGPPVYDGFEPWPRVPGDIWGYPMNRPIEQPSGHESRQTGPNRWIYRPIYGAPPSPAPAAGVRPGPAIAPPAAQTEKIEPPRPSDAGPDDFVPPDGTQPKRVPLGKRQF